MAGRLVTIATFELPAKARLAQNILQEAGIKSTIADETTVAMDWLLGAAIGWVKVQVMEEDAERAVTALEESLGTPDDPVDQDALAAEAEASTPEEESEEPAPAPPKPSKPWDPKPPAPVPPGPEPEPIDEAEPNPSERDEYARRFFLAAIFGLVIPLLWFYAVYLFLNAAFGEGTLSARARSKLRIGGVVLLFGFFTALYLIRLFGDPFP